MNYGKINPRMSIENALRETLGEFVKEIAKEFPSGTFREGHEGYEDRLGMIFKITDVHGADIWFSWPISSSSAANEITVYITLFEDSDVDEQFPSARIPIDVFTVERAATVADRLLEDL